VLHITNGESVSGSLRAAGISGVTLAWNDVLHDGPVPGGLALEVLSRVRAQFLASQGWLSLEEVLADFRSRDAALARYSDHDEVVLWFEHDLYDQLQLIQILDWFAARYLGGARLTAIHSAVHLGEQQPATLSALFPTRTAVTGEQLSTARRAWNAFTNPDPRPLEAGDWTALPHLVAAFHRWLEEFPSTHNGLGRSRNQILQLLAGRPLTPVDLFVWNGDLEHGAHYVGDWSFFSYLRELSSAPSPALLHEDGQTFIPRRSLRTPLVLTPFGRDLLAGQADWIRTHGIDRWLGGVRLSGADAAWRWSGSALYPRTHGTSSPID
jgi:hypothetical protein